MTAHIFATEPDEGIEWKHNDWFYEIMFNIKGRWFRVSGTKLYKRRCWASRVAKAMGLKVEHWYPI
jgi:hypothetical protein